MSTHHVCPWWIGYLLASPIRRLWQDPHAILNPHVKDGMTVLEPGPGMGFFTIELLRLAGESGRVIAVDIQPRMLHSLEARVRRAGLSGRLDARLADATKMPLNDLEAKVDFALVFAMVHELPDALTFFEQVSRSLRPGGRLLLVEPTGHVKPAQFDGELEQAARAGLNVLERPAISRSQAALLEKTR